MILAAGAAAAFLLLALGVVRGEADAFDRRVMEGFAALSNPATDAFFLAITWLGSSFILIPVVMLIGLALAAYRRSRDAVFLIALYSSATLGTWLLKSVFERERPQLHAALVQISPGDWSFPSSHTTQAAAFALGLWLLVTRLRPAWSVPAGLVLGALALLVAVSRLHLQVHWPSDLLGGWLAAFFWLGIITAAFGRLRSHAP